jgi:hypothetical protein
MNERIEKLEAENAALKEKLNELIKAFNNHAHVMGMESWGSNSYTDDSPRSTGGKYLDVCPL